MKTQNACEPRINVIYLHPELAGITVMCQTQTFPCIHCTIHFLVILSFCPICQWCLSSHNKSNIETVHNINFFDSNLASVSYLQKLLAKLKPSSSDEALAEKEKPEQLLKEVTFEGVGKYIKEGQCEYTL